MRTSSLLQATAQAATATTAALAPYSTTSAITALLNQKQATISVGTGCFLNGTTLSGYGLRWNATNVPSGTIEEIHWSGYTVAQTANLGTGKVELTIGHPTGMATTTQLALKQGLLSSSTDLTLQDLTYRFLPGGCASSAFT